MAVNTLSPLYGVKEMIAIVAPKRELAAITKDNAMIAVEI